MKFTPSKYSYADFVEFTIYSDLKSSLKANDRLTVSSNEELEEVTEQLNEMKIPYVFKSKREVWITS